MCPTPKQARRVLRDRGGDETVNFRPPLFGETLTSIGPELELQAGYTYELAHVGRDHRQPVGDAGGGEPEVVRPDEHPRLRQLGPELRVGR